MNVYKFMVLMYCNILFRMSTDAQFAQVILLGTIFAIVLTLLVSLEHFIVPLITFVFNWIIRQMIGRYLARGPIVPDRIPANFPHAFDFIVFSAIATNYGHNEGSYWYFSPGG